MIATASPSLTPRSESLWASAFVRRLISSKLSEPSSSMTAIASGLVIAEETMPPAGVGPHLESEARRRTTRSGRVPPTTLASISVRRVKSLFDIVSRFMERNLLRSCAPGAQRRAGSASMTDTTGGAHGLRRGAMAAALAGLALLAGAAGAQAATYHAFLCRVPYGPRAGAIAPTVGVTGGRGGPPPEVTTDCTGGASMTTFTNAPIQTGIGSSDNYVPGAGVTIVGFRLWRQMQAIGNTPAGTDFVANVYTDGGATVDGLCLGSSLCMRG